MATTSIHENTFPYIEVNAIINITTDASSVANTLTFNIVNSTGPTTLQSFTQAVAATTATNYVVGYNGIYRKNDKGTITLQLAQSGAADATHTTITLQGWYVKHLEVLHPTSGQTSR